MVMKQPFTTTSPILASYDYRDLSGNTGFIKFYLAATRQAGATTYRLSDQIIYSQSSDAAASKVIETATTMSTNAEYTKIQDLDFDLSAFQAPQIIQGTAILTIGTRSNTSGDRQPNYYNVFILKKVSGGVETTVGTIQTDSFQGTGVAMWSVAMTCTKTNFKIGDILRLTVETWNRKTSGTTGTMTYAIGHDPMNRDGAYVIPTTQDNITASHALIPFAIEV